MILLRIQDVPGVIGEFVELCKL